MKKTYSPSALWCKLPSVMNRDRIQHIIDTRIAPLFQVDGGTVHLLDVTDDGGVVLHLSGACAGCPGADYALNDLVLPLLQSEVPEVQSVIAVPFLPSGSGSR